MPLASTFSCHISLIGRSKALVETCTENRNWQHNSLLYRRYGPLIVSGKHEETALTIVCKEITSKRCNHSITTQYRTVLSISGAITTQYRIDGRLQFYGV